MWLSNRELIFSFLNNLFACTKQGKRFLGLILKENFKARDFPPCLGSASLAGEEMRCIGNIPFCAGSRFV